MNIFFEKKKKKKLDSGRLSGTFRKTETGEAYENIQFQPPKSWSNIILNEDFFSFFYQVFFYISVLTLFKKKKKKKKLHCVVSKNSRLATHSSQCLIQLTTTTGQILSNQDVKIKFANSLIVMILKMLEK